MMERHMHDVEKLGHTERFKYPIDQSHEWPEDVLVIDQPGPAFDLNTVRNQSALNDTEALVLTQSKNSYYRTNTHEGTALIDLRSLAEGDTNNLVLVGPGTLGPIAVGKAWSIKGFRVSTPVSKVFIPYQFTAPHQKPTNIKESPFSLVGGVGGEILGPDRNITRAMSIARIALSKLVDY